METQNKTVITIETTVNIPVEKAWKIWNTVDDIIKWNSPSPEWHTARAENDLRKGGKFLFRMKPGMEALLQHRDSANPFQKWRKMS